MSQKSPDSGLSERLSHLHGPRVLLLSGGGGNGAAEAGAVLELLSHDYTPDLIVGTSIGAWNAAYLAAHPGMDGARDLVRLWRGGAFAQMAIPGAKDAVQFLRRQAPSPVGSQMVARITAATGLGETRWDQLAVPLVLGATDVHSGELRYWDASRAMEPRVAPYIAASSALAPLQPLATVEGEQYADAGLKDNYGIREAVSLLGDQPGSLLVLDAAPRAASGPVVTPAAGLRLFLGLVFQGRLQEDAAAARDAGHRLDVIALGGNHSVLNYWDPSVGIKVGRAAVRNWGHEQHTYPQWRRLSVPHTVANVVRFVAKTPRLERAARRQQAMVAELG